MSLYGLLLVPMDHPYKFSTMCVLMTEDCDIGLDANCGLRSNGCGGKCVLLIRVVTIYFRA